MLQMTKARNSLQAFSAFPAGVPTRLQNSIILEAEASQWLHRWIPGPSHCQEDVKSPAPENTENSLEPGCDFQRKCDINTTHHRQGFWAGSRRASSPRETPGMNSSAWPPSLLPSPGDQRAADSLQQGWRMGSTLETRCHLSHEHQGTKHPITYLTSCPRVTVGPRECWPVKIYPVSFKPH